MSNFDDWGTGNNKDWDSSEGNSDFDFGWDPEGNFQQAVPPKKSRIAFVKQQPLWIKISSGVGVGVIFLFVFLQAGGFTKLRTMGVFRESISAEAMCLNGLQVAGELALGAFNNVVMNRAIDHADRVKSQRSGDAAVDEAAWAVADSAYIVQEAVQSIPGALSSADMMLGDALDSLNSDGVKDATLAVTRASELLSAACGSEAEDSTAITGQGPPKEPEEIPSNPTEESPQTDPTDLGEQDLYAPPLDLESFIREITQSTVEIECAASEGAELADAGSGFVIDVSDLTGGANPELAIVTNHHVIEICADGDGVLFVGQGDEYIESKVLGYDFPNDLALVGLGSMNLDPLPVSSDISVGQWVMTSGSPVGIESNVTFGQVTSTSILSETGGSEQIASDAVIGPGNSGGPLVNRAGQAIGVNSAVFMDATGISVSVPVSYLCVSILACRN